MDSIALRGAPLAAQETDMANVLPLLLSVPALLLVCGLLSCVCVCVRVCVRACVCARVIMPSYVSM